jgi:DNA-binding transcriptional LysR family regulator
MRSRTVRICNQRAAGALSPNADHWSGHAIGRSIRRLTPKPRGSRPSIAALTRAGHIFKGPDPKSIEGAMAAGSLDIAIGYLPEAPNALIRSTLFREPFVCIARRGHPALQDGVLSLDRFVEMQHVQALMKDGTMYAAAIDTALANHGLVRKVALWQPSFFALPHVVERTDLIGTVPKRVGVHAAENLAIEIYEVPLPAAPAGIRALLARAQPGRFGTSLAARPNRGALSHSPSIGTFLGNFSPAT